MALDPTVLVREAAVSAVAEKVGNLVSTIWDYSLGLVANIIFLSRRAEEVAGEMEELEDLRKDLMCKLEAEEDEADVSYQLSGWMKKLQVLRGNASSFQNSFEDQSMCITRFRLGYEAVELLRQSRKLAEEGKVFFSGAPPPLSRPRGPDPVKQVPSETSSSTVVGGNEALRRVQSCIIDDGVGIVGVYGMGGVGKTTLLKMINNEFLNGEACRDKFEVAIWVTVSRDVQISTIQESIADRLGLKLTSDSITRKETLFGELSKKRFVLLLDDVWEKLNLMEIGIPRPKISNNNKSKILFTTRKIDVCGEMDVDEKVKINLLDDQSSRDLFRSKIGREATRVLDDPNIRQLAEEVVRRCGGLPIALITVGRAMSNARTAYDWKDAIRKLDHRPADLSPGMEEEVLKSLKFSFEKLRNDALRNCLLYCALFPEDYEIPKEKIIDYWICEGFLDLEDFDEEINIEDTRCRGNALITELQNACLLEGRGSDESDDDFVMLHDTIRDMVLWIARHDFVVLAGYNKNVNSPQIPKLSIWESAKKISLMYNREVEEPPSSSPGQNLSCPNLTTLLLQDSGVAHNISKSFFNFTSMAALRVLDLKSRYLSEFPTEITWLISLRYLCLSDNGFASLPVELGNLANLRHLILRHTRHLTWIPKKAISRLSRLQVLDMDDSGYKFGRDDDTGHRQLELSDLANLKRLCELHLPVCRSWASLGVIAASPVLRRSTRSIDLVTRKKCVSPPPPGARDAISEQIGSMSELRILKLSDKRSDPAVMVGLQLYPTSRLRHLEVLHLGHVMISSTIHTSSSRHHSEESLFLRLRVLSIIDCDGFSELTWVGPLPCLERLYVSGCEGLREVLQVDGGSRDHHHHLLVTTPIIIFPKLKHMVLLHLPSLGSISDSTLLFPCLESLTVARCPLLRRLPLGPASAKNLEEIQGKRSWWDGLEWDNHADQESFSSKLVPL